MHCTRPGASAVIQQGPLQSSCSIVLLWSMCLASLAPHLVQVARCLCGCTPAAAPPPATHAMGAGAAPPSCAQQHSPRCRLLRAGAAGPAGQQGARLMGTAPPWYASAWALCSAGGVVHGGARRAFVLAQPVAKHDCLACFMWTAEPAMRLSNAVRVPASYLDSSESLPGVCCCCKCSREMGTSPGTEA